MTKKELVEEFESIDVRLDGFACLLSVVAMSDSSNPNYPGAVISLDKMIENILDATSAFSLNLDNFAEKG